MHVAELKIRAFWAASNCRFFGALNELQSARHIPNKVDLKVEFLVKIVSHFNELLTKVSIINDLRAI
jgi:hypothetical protein